MEPLKTNIKICVLLGLFTVSDSFRAKCFAFLSNFALTSNTVFLVSISGAFFFKNASDIEKATYAFYVIAAGLISLAWNGIILKQQIPFKSLLLEYQQVIKKSEFRFFLLIFPLFQLMMDFLKRKPKCFTLNWRFRNAKWHFVQLRWSGNKHRNIYKAIQHCLCKRSGGQHDRNACSSCRLSFCQWNLWSQCMVSPVGYNVRLKSFHLFILVLCWKINENLCI